MFLRELLSTTILISTYGRRGEKRDTEKEFRKRACEEQAIDTFMEY